MEQKLTEEELRSLLSSKTKELDSMYKENAKLFAENVKLKEMLDKQNEVVYFYTAKGYDANGTLLSYQDGVFKPDVKNPKDIYELLREVVLSSMKENVNESIVKINIESFNKI